MQPRFTLEQVLAWRPFWLQPSDITGQSDWSALELWALCRMDVHRIWVATRPGVLEPSVLRGWLASAVDRALGRIRDPDPRSVAVVAALRQDGQVSPAVRDEALHAAGEQSEEGTPIDIPSYYAAWCAYYAALAFPVVVTPAGYIPDFAAKAALYVDIALDDSDMAIQVAELRALIA
jgi:hypothetical protein